jgi:hypothetical protein
VWGELAVGWGLPEARERSPTDGSPARGRIHDRVRLLASPTDRERSAPTTRPEPEATGAAGRAGPRWRREDDDLAVRAARPTDGVINHGRVAFPTAAPPLITLTVTKSRETAVSPSG